MGNKLTKTCWVTLYMAQVSVFVFASAGLPWPLLGLPWVLSHIVLLQMCPQFFLLLAIANEHTVWQTPLCSRFSPLSALISRRNTDRASKGIISSRIVIFNSPSFIPLPVNQVLWFILSLSPSSDLKDSHWNKRWMEKGGCIRIWNRSRWNNAINCTVYNHVPGTDLM